MASKCRTINRAVLLVVLAAALATAIGGTLSDFFSIKEIDIPTNRSSSVGSGASGLNAADGDVFIPPPASAAATAFVFPSSASLSSATMDLWEVAITYTAASSLPKATAPLRSEYFTCTQGQTNIQVAEAFATVTCVVCCANLILAVFIFFFSTVVRVPLAVYAGIAAGCAGVVVGMTAHAYLHPWCPASGEGGSNSTSPSVVFGNGAVSLKEQGWGIKGAGLPLFAVSAALSVAAMLMTAIGG